MNRDIEPQAIIEGQRLAVLEAAKKEEEKRKAKLREEEKSSWDCLTVLKAHMKSERAKYPIAVALGVECRSDSYKKRVKENLEPLGYTVGFKRETLYENKEAKADNPNYFTNLLTDAGSTEYYTYVSHPSLDQKLHKKSIVKTRFYQKINFQDVQDNPQRAGPYSIRDLAKMKDPISDWTNNSSWEFTHIPRTQYPGDQKRDYFSRTHQRDVRDSYPSNPFLEPSE